MKVIYTCHYCGQEAVFGEHFCKEARKVRKAMKKGGTGGGIGSAGAGPGDFPGESPGTVAGSGAGRARESGRPDGAGEASASRDPDRDLGYDVPAWEKKARKDRLSAAGAGAEDAGRGRVVLGYLASALVAAAVVAAMLYGTVGSLALWIIPVALLVGLAAAMLRKSGTGGRRYGELLSLVGGDRELADRLVRAEAGRNPGLDQGAWVDLAIQRLLRDRLR